MAIGGVDKLASKKIAMKLLRKAKELRTVRNTNMQLKAYSPLWFSIRMHPSCKDGVRHLFRKILLSRYLTKELLDIIDPVLQRYGYFGHPEHLLLAMIIDQ